MTAVHQRITLIGVVAEVCGAVIVFFLPARSVGVRFLHVIFFAAALGAVVGVVMIAALPVWGYIEGRRRNKEQ